MRPRVACASASAPANEHNRQGRESCSAVREQSTFSWAGAKDPISYSAATPTLTGGSAGVNLSPGRHSYQVDKTDGAASWAPPPSQFRRRKAVSAREDGRFGSLYRLC